MANSGLQNWKYLALYAVLLLGACIETREIFPTTIVSSQSTRASERNDRLEILLPQLVAESSVPGISLLIFENGRETYFGLSGDLDRENSIPLTRQAVGRYYSMTKPIVGVALMTLFEDGKFELDDPVKRYLPEFAGLQVYEDGSLVEARREVTIRDLMRHTAGMTYGFFSQTPVDKMYRSAGILNYEDTNARFTQKLARMPLLAQPGERWIYSVSVDVQGRLIEVLSGQTLGDFLQTTLFDPLAMTHTGFTVQAEDRALFGPVYHLSEAELKPVFDDDPEALLPVNAPFLSKMPFESGGGGLVSTVDDYANFAKMLLAGGVLGDQRILKAETLALMTRDQLGTADPGWLGAGVGFGLDFAVQLDPPPSGALPVPVGSYSWGGMAGTFFWVDPKNELTAVMQIQVLGANEAHVRDRVVAAVYGVDFTRQKQ